MQFQRQSKFRDDTPIWSQNTSIEFQNWKLSMVHFWSNRLDVFHISWPLGDAVPKLCRDPQVMVIKTHTKFGLNSLKRCGDIVLDPFWRALSLKILFLPSSIVWTNRSTLNWIGECFKKNAQNCKLLFYVIIFFLFFKTIRSPWDS